MTGPTDSPGAPAAPDSSEEGQAFLNLLGWPPPGLARVQADLWLVVRRTWVAGAVLVLPLAFVISVPQSPMGLGPLGGAWWIALVTTLFGVVLFADASVALFRLLARARRAVLDGYSPYLVGLVVSDRARDGGFLFQGAQIYSTMTDDERRMLSYLRIVGPMLYLAAALWLTMGFSLLVLLAARGGVSLAGIALGTSVPTLLLSFLGLVVRATEGTLLGRARKAWFKQPWSEDLAKRDVADWRNAVQARGLASASTSGTGTARLLGFSSVLVVIMAFVTIVPPVTLVPVSSVGAVFGSVAGFRYYRTFERMVEAEPLRPYRLAADSSISAAEAGDLLNVISNAGNTRALEPGLRAPVRAVTEAWMPPSPVEGLRTDIPPFWTDSLWAHFDGGLSSWELDYLRLVDNHPARADLRRLARAPSIDVIAGQYELPFDEAMTFWALPFPRTSSLREAAYTHLGVAALRSSEGRHDEAEEAVREVISFGFLLMEESPTLIGNLIGAVLVELGGDALVSVMHASGNPTGADRLAQSLAAAERAIEQVSPVMRLPTDAEEYLERMPEMAANASVPRGLRWENVNLVATVSPCVNLRRVVFGPGQEYADWLEEVHASLVRYPSEEALFGLASRGFAFDDEPGVILRLLSVAMSGMETRGSCSELVNGLVNFM